jgi:hypothetical protein
VEKENLENLILKMLESFVCKNKTADFSFKKISNDCNISIYWLRKFYKNEIPNPGVKNIQTLFEYFSGKNLSSILEENVK